IGDLAFFYDMNVIGNRHIGSNIRLLLVNNGKGTEFRQFNHIAAAFGGEADRFIAAAGHFGNQSQTLVKHYAGDLGFEYFSAANKQEFEEVYHHFLLPQITERPMLFEVFTDSAEESEALERIINMAKDLKGRVKKIAKEMLGGNSLNVLKKITR
ncbi:MAG: 2-succinyl-5-enolpyruvyl-6-hydroxy-3-cyclohexene-1-carboxylate synthase, partial [Mangrovibacterium sp.]